jgi:hypothetical protein
MLVEQQQQQQRHQELFYVTEIFNLTTVNVIFCLFRAAVVIREREFHPL